MMSRIYLTACLISSCGTAALAQNLRYEVEEGQMFGTYVSNSVSGYSGDGYVTGFDGSSGVEDYFQLQVDVPDGLYEMWVGYRSPYGQKGYTYEVDGVLGDGTFSQSTTFAEDRAGVFSLQGGLNTLGIHQNWGWYDVDYFEFRPYQPTPLLPVSAQLTNPLADLPTRQLMGYLVSQYGQKTLSGQHHEQGHNLSFPVQSYLEKSGGIVPAVRSSDFIDYSPSRIQYGANPRNETEESIQWAQQSGGVVSMMWHWNAPTDLINQPDKEWWRGFYSDATTFDLPGALANPGSSDYQLLLRDIDAIATELQKFEDAGVPVVWHPLHEAQGGWFWWGAHGPDAFKSLWNLVYDRLTHDHGLDNLIWEYALPAGSAGGFSTDWYPGDDRVDMVGLDIYTDSTSNMSGEWNEALDLFNGSKMIALSESGTLPDPDTMNDFGVAWSYFSPWKGSFVDAMAPAELQATLNHEDVVTLDELPTLPWKQDSLPGDFNFDGAVDAADYSVWRDGLGEVYRQDDYLTWRDNYGATASEPATSSIPEPTASTLLGLALTGLADFLKNRRRYSR